MEALPGVISFVDVLEYLETLGGVGGVGAPPELAVALEAVRVAGFGEVVGHGMQWRSFFAQA